MIPAMAGTQARGQSLSGSNPNHSTTDHFGGPPEAESAALEEENWRILPFPAGPDGPAETMHMLGTATDEVLDKPDPTVRSTPVDSRRNSYEDTFTVSASDGRRLETRRQALTALNAWFIDCHYAALRAQPTDVFPSVVRNRPGQQFAVV